MTAVDYKSALLDADVLDSGPSPWVGHIPFAFWIIKQLQPHILVELGVYYGHSYFSFCQAVFDNGLSTKCYAVDTWQGDEHAGFYGEEVFAAVNAHNQRMYHAFSQLLRMPFDEAVTYFSDSTIDLLHIDGLHTYEAVRHDFEMWLPKLSSRGVVLFHDISVRERGFGVWRLWEELSASYPHIEFEHSCGLGVLFVGDTQPTGIMKLLEEWSTPDGRHFIKRFFVKLGQLVSLEYQANSLTKSVVERDGQIAGLNQALIERNGQIAGLNQALSERDGQIAGLKQAMVEREGQIAGLKQAVAERDGQIAGLNQALIERNGQIANFEAQLAAIYASRSRRITAPVRAVGTKLRQMKERGRAAKTISHFVLNNGPRAGYRLFKERYLLLSSDAFDCDYYRSQYPDVTAAQIDPALHYLLYGVSEGRNPSPLFDTCWYLQHYPDVVKAGINPLVHYLRFGREEGRCTALKKQEKQASFVLVPVGRKILFGKKLAYYFKRFIAVWQQEGARVALKRGLNKLSKNSNEHAGQVSMQQNDESLPIVSIIIPVYNALPLTKACLNSLYENTGGINFEVIVVDNASQDGTFEWLDEERNQHFNLKVFRMDKNIGFGLAVNIGLQHSKGKFLVILNNDTLVAPNWLDNLLSAIERDPSIGIVSPVTNYVGEGPQIDTSAQNLPAVPVAIAQYARSISECSDLFYEPNRLVFFCVLIRRELVDLIGYLDEGYVKGNFEDDDYCLRARMMGYRLAIVRNSFVYHHGTATFKLNRISHEKWMEANRGRFYQKAGTIATSLRPWITSLPNREAPNREALVSVIVRTKDRQKLLKRALASLANQTWKDFNVVLINDGGRDVSSLIGSFQKYFPITYINHDVSRGRTAAINAGLKCAQGKYIAYLDDDDILYPWHFEVLMQAIEMSGAKVAYCNYNRALFADTDSLFPIQLVGVPPWEYNRNELLVQNHLPIHTYVHLRECIQKTGLWNENLDRLEDYYFLLQLSAFFDFYHVKKVTCEYRYYIDSENSITARGRHKYLTALQKIYQQFPVTESRLLHARQLVIHGLQNQVEEIERIIRNTKSATIDDFDIQREIIRVVVGI